MQDIYEKERQQRESLQAEKWQSPVQEDIGRA